MKPLVLFLFVLGLTSAAPNPALAVDPYVDTGFAEVTPLPDADLVVVRERFHGAVGVDLSAYGIAGGPHTYVQSLYIRLFADAPASQPEAFTGLIVLPPSVTILGIITDGDDLGGADDDSLFTAADSLFGVGADPDLYSENARGFEAGSGTSGSEFIGLVDAHTLAFGVNASFGVDDFRVIIDYGDSIAADLSFDLLAVDVGTLGGLVPFDGIRLGDDASPTIFGSGNYGETRSLVNIPLTSTVLPDTSEAVPFQPEESLFIARDTSGLTKIDSFDTSLGVPLPGMFELNNNVSNPRGITDHEDGKLYCVGRDGGFGTMDVDTRVVATDLMANLTGNVIDVTNLPGDDDVFGLRNTPGESQIDRIDPTVPEVTASWDILGPTTPVAIADGGDGLLYVLGQSGTLAWCDATGAADSSITLTPPTGSYDGMTGRPGTQLLYLLRDTSGDSKVDVYDIATGLTTYDIATLPLPTSPSDITDGPNDLLYVVGDGSGAPTAFTAVDPLTGDVLALFDLLDFTGIYRTITGYDPTAAPVTAVPEDRGRPGPTLRHLAWPNPFSPRVEIRFELPAPARVYVQILDVQGRELRVLREGLGLAGWNTLRWDGRDGQGRNLPSGAYFYRILAGEEVATGKLVMVR